MPRQCLGNARGVLGVCRGVSCYSRTLYYFYDYRTARYNNAYALTRKQLRIRPMIRPDRHKTHTSWILSWFRKRVSLLQL